MASLTEHVLINKLSDDLADAIKSVGGSIPQSSNMLHYPEIIEEQLKASNISLGDEVIVEGCSLVIESDDKGQDIYENNYSSGVKDGLKPNTLYLRLCLAVEDSVPVYIELTKIIEESNNIENFIERLTEEDINKIIHG